MSGTTSLGMPPMPPRTSWPTWKQAWDAALYGADGFFRRESPADHFRTSVHASPALAEALVTLCRQAGLDTVVDVGAGRGELLRALHHLDPSLTLLGVEVATRPSDLPEAVAWSPVLPMEVDGLIFANEWLDNIPCHVAEVDDDGHARVVHVDPATGRESLGARLDDPAVPGVLQEWCQTWWPLSAHEPGTRAEIGTTRDRAWADVVTRVTRGLAVGVDYGHTRDGRPAFGSLRSYLRGHEVELLVDGSRDVTAHVAVDAVAAATHGAMLSQREALGILGVTADRPDLERATADPAGYLAALAQTTQSAELLAAGGLGDFYWIVSEVGVASSLRRA